jgi:putative ABC transport system permease protein
MSRQIVGNNALSGTAITGLWLATGSSNDLDAAQFQVTNLLRLRHNIQPPAADDFNLTNQVDIINTFSYVMNLLTLMVTAIAGISLIVGGIGIANIMLVSVVERTREIGIRKALGATNRTILHQFLIEALLLSTIGGGIGILLGVIIAVAAAMSFNIPLVISFWSTLLGVFLSSTVGLLAGAVPARNAAQLDPIAALRSE